MGAEQEMRPEHDPAREGSRCARPHDRSGASARATVPASDGRLMTHALPSYEGATLDLVADEAQRT